jgi:hypothetical protein
VKEIHEVKQKIANIENKRIIEELNLPDEDLLALGFEKPINNNTSRKLSESEIKEAQEHSNNATGCSKYLNVKYHCYKKWADYYGIFKKNPWIKGSKKKRWSSDEGKYPLTQILEGKYPNYPIQSLKDRLIKCGIKKPICENCGFSENRITDNKIPLLISFKDGNEKNHLLENIEILCLNCTFLVGRGYINNGNPKLIFLEDRF